MTSTLEIYYRLRDEVDRKVSVLEELHAGWMACRRGCSSCCLDLTVWPVEFYAILEEMRASGGDASLASPDAACGFLDGEGGCQIYPFRPIICRTHGLPLVYWYEDHDPPGYGVIFCDKHQEATQAREFTATNTLNMDEVNEKLARINLVFLEELNDSSLQPDSRIQLRKVFEYL